MGEKVDAQAGGRQRVGWNKPAGRSSTGSAPAGRKRRRTVLAALAVLAVGVGAWALWPRQRHWEEITLDLGNNVTMRLVLIPAGKFTMGSPDSEANRSADEGPQHEVTISKPFYMGVHEVTQEQYQQVMGTNPSFFKGAANPVERVSWDDAMEFCRKLSEKTGRKVTLPTEAQWEYACRAGTTTAFNTGDELKASQANADFTAAANPGPWEKALAWVRKVLRIKAKTVGAETLPVGGFPPNGFGLYDMHGNIWEWCADWYGEGYYANANNTDPTGPASGSMRVLRGGGWSDHPSICRSAFRNWGDPDARFCYFGFRVAVLPGLD